LIGGPVEPTAELQQLLSKRVRGRLIDRLSLPVTASHGQILEQAVRLGERLERQMEEQIVEDLLAGDDKHHPITLGLEPTVHALCEERIWRYGLRRRFHAVWRPVFILPDVVCDA
jgi:hypothetical protein